METLKRVKTKSAIEVYKGKAIKQIKDAIKLAGKGIYLF